MLFDLVLNLDVGRSRLNVYFLVLEIFFVILDFGIEGYRVKGRMYLLLEFLKLDENKIKFDFGRVMIGSKGLEDNWIWSSDVF